MDTKYEVILTARAKADLKGIYKYISEKFKEKETAKKLIETIQNKILILEDIPEGFSIVNFYNRRKYEYHKIIIKNFVAIYRIDKKTKIVYVVKIVYARKNYLNEK